MILAGERRTGPAPRDYIEPHEIQYDLPRPNMRLTGLREYGGSAHTAPILQPSAEQVYWRNMHIELGLNGVFDSTLPAATDHPLED